MEQPGNHGQGQGNPQVDPAVQNLINVVSDATRAVGHAGSAVLFTEQARDHLATSIVMMNQLGEDVQMTEIPEFVENLEEAAQHLAGATAFRQLANTDVELARVALGQAHGLLFPNAAAAPGDGNAPGPAAPPAPAAAGGNGPGAAAGGNDPGAAAAGNAGN